MSDIVKFKAIFNGLESAYGTYTIESEREDTKQVGKGFVVREVPTDIIWQKHLDGKEPSLGIIPIRSDQTCVWGAFDIDEYNLDHKNLVGKIKKMNLPLIVFRSKSGGAHVYMFVKEPLSAADMQKHIKLFAAYLGFANCEVFPKQTKLLVDRGDVGNFLNLPYFGGDNSNRYAFKENGDAATLEEFFELYEEKVVRNNKEIPKPEVESEDIPDGPPCLQYLCNQGFPEGTRNNGLFNIGVYLKKSHPDSWEDKMLEANQKYMSPSLPLNEINTVVKQLNKKDYNYKCKDSPINAHCSSGICKMRKYGIGASEADIDGPSITALVKYNSDPPLWFLDVEGHRIELTTEELQQQHKFQIVCMNKINVAPPTRKKMEWEALLNKLLRQMVETQAIQEAPEDTSHEGRFADLLEEFCTHFQSGIDREEILMGRPWTSEEDNYTYFRMKDLESFLSRNRFMSLTTPKIAQRLRSMNGEAVSQSIKSRTVRLWKIPAFKKQTEPFKVSSSVSDDDIPF